MADFPRVVKPAHTTPLRVPGGFISPGHTGKAQLRAALAIGFEWDESWNAIRVGTPNVDALLAFIEDAWNQSKTFEIAHWYTPGSGLARHGLGGASGAAPLVSGASQTGASLLTDGWAGNNYANNPGFETGAIAPHATIPAGGAFFLVSSAVQRTGSFGAAYDPGSQAAVAEIQVNGSKASSAGHRTAQQGDTFHAECWARSDSAAACNQVRVLIGFYDAAGGALEETVGAAITPTTTYARARHIATAPAGTAYVVSVLQILDDGQTNPIYIDDLSLRYASAVRAGDVIKVAGLPQLIRVTADANMDENGAATLLINPPIVAGGSPADNAEITTTGNKMTAYIASRPILPATRPGRYLIGLELTFREAL